MDKVEMLRRAAECRVLAKAALQLDAQLIFLEVAETWEKLARQQGIIEIDVPDAVIAKAALDDADASSDVDADK